MIPFGFNDSLEEEKTEKEVRFRKKEGVKMKDSMTREKKRRQKDRFVFRCL